MQKPDHYTVFDLETSGLSPIRDAIIEIGAVKVVDGQVVDKFSEFCRFDGTLPPVITEVTGISDATLAGARDKKNVLQDFIEFAGSDVLIGHNIEKFDMPFLNNELVRQGFNRLNNNLIDTLKISYKYANRMQSHKLISLLNYYNIEYDVLHRALDDAVATHKLFEAMVPTTASKNKPLQSKVTLSF